MSEIEHFFYSALGVVALLGLPVGVVAGLTVSPLATAITALAALAYGGFFVRGTRIQWRQEVRAYRTALIEQRQLREAEQARHSVEQASLLRVVQETRPAAYQTWCDLLES